MIVAFVDSPTSQSERALPTNLPSSSSTTKTPTAYGVIVWNDFIKVPNTSILRSTYTSEIFHSSGFSEVWQTVKQSFTVGLSTPIQHITRGATQCTLTGRYFEKSTMKLLEEPLNEYNIWNHQITKLKLIEEDKWRTQGGVIMSSVQ